jgi:hypothetical protein
MHDIWRKQFKGNLAIAPRERGALICPTSCFPEFASSPLPENISLFQKRKSGVWMRHLAPLRGAYRDRHDTWREMRWTRSCATTKRIGADGKIAWS